MEATLTSPDLDQSERNAVADVDAVADGPWHEQIRELCNALADVNPMTISEWEEAFRRDNRPEKEVAYWLQVSSLYQQAVSRRTNLPLELRKQALHWILSNHPHARLWQAARPVERM